MLFFLFGSSPLFCYTRLQWTKEGMIASTLTNIKMEETVPVLRLLWKERKTLVETFEGLLIDTYVLQEQPMMLTGINLQLECPVYGPQYLPSSSPWRTWTGSSPLCPG